MQDEINEKAVALCISGGKISAGVLKAALSKLLEERERTAAGTEPPSLRGKQSLKKLTERGAGLSDIEVTDGNIRSFERCARKYHVSYSLKKDRSVSPPRWFVFFRAKDADVMTAAFKEYCGRQLGKEKKPSVLRKLTLAKERAVRQMEKTKTRQKERGPEH